MSRRSRDVLVAAMAALALAAAAACGEDPAVDAGPEDAGPEDAGGADAGASRDAGSLDGGPAPSGDWRTEPAVPVAVQEIAAAAHGGRIWIAGGFEGGVVVATVRVFDPSSGAWTEGPALPAPRHHMTLVSHGDALYALGGMQTTAFEPLDTAWVLRDGADAWAPIASLPEDRGAAAGGSVGDRIVLAGGNGRRGGLATTTLVYDPAGDAWTVGAAIPSEREHLAAVAHAGELWVLGGRRNSLGSTRSDVEIYDPVGDAWRAGPAMPYPRGGFAAALLDGSIYVVGGEEPDRVLTSVDRLDLGALEWSAAPPTTVAHHGHGVVALGGRLWVIAGGDRPAFAPIDDVESYAP